MYSVHTKNKRMRDMGTRGTLRVYVDGELRVRQYNQFDSYPTGQFAGICNFMQNADDVEELAYRLKKTRFYTKEEVDMARKLFDDDRSVRAVSPEELDKYVNIMFLTNRVYGFNILYQILALCRNDAESIKGYAIPDWTVIFDCKDEELMEEGNYAIDIDTKGSKIHFTLSGDWHGIKREFPPDHIPTMDEILVWEQEDQY